MNNSLPLVSIVAANYNNAAYVIDSLNSVRDQTYQNIELIIVDDASTDNSPALIDQWLQNYNQPYKFIKHEKNYGICRTCNDLVNNASGKFISFLATDDMYLPDKITNQVKILEESEASVAMVYSDTYLLDQYGNRKLGTFMTTLSKCTFEYGPSGNILPELQKQHFVHWLSVLVKKEIFNNIGLFDENLPFEDYDMSLRIARKYTIKYSPDIQILYRVHAQSISAKTKNWQPLLLPIYFKHIDLPGFKKEAAAIILNYYLNKNINTREWLIKYYQATNEKFTYYFFNRK